MATPGFGFSVGDFIAGVSLVKKLIRALNDAAGSRAAYRKLISELLDLVEVLTEIGKLQLGPAQAQQKLALQRVAMQCQTSIEAFIFKNAKFGESLGLLSSTRSPSWRTSLHKIQWALFKDNAIDGLRTEIAAHTASLNVTLATIQVSTSTLNEQCLDNCTQLLRVVRDETKEANSRIMQNQQILVAHTGWMETMTRTVAGFVSEQKENGLVSLVYKALHWNMRIFDAVTQMQQLLRNIPPQIEREQPVLFEDAHGRLAPFHVEFINSYAAFQAVLEARFQNMPGLRKVRNLEYSMQDTRSKHILDLSRPWENNFRPGRRFNMSMIFQVPSRQTSSCPGCLTESFNRVENGESDVQCENPECRIFYRCIPDANDSKLGKRKRSESCRSPAKRAKHGQKDNGPDDDDDTDKICDFRRVQIMQRDSSNSMEQFTSLKDTTMTDVKDIYHNVHVNGASAVIEQLFSGRDLKDTVVHERECNISSPRSHLLEPTDTRARGDLSGADSWAKPSPAGWLDLDDAVSSPYSDRAGLSPGWAPLSEYATKAPWADTSITADTSDSYQLLPLPQPVFVPVHGVPR